MEVRRDLPTETFEIKWMQRYMIFIFLDGIHCLQIAAFGVEAPTERSKCEKREKCGGGKSKSK